MSSRRIRRPPSLNLSITSRDPPTPPHSEFDSDDERMAPATSSSSSSSRSHRPMSIAMSQTPYCQRRPTLAEILSNTAPPPYTLSAFMAYLSQNHCLETLEFTMDASRYRKHSNPLNPACGPMMADSESCDYVRMLWQKLLDAYIAPNGPREVNLPGGIRENLLNYPNKRTPPPPETLDQAVNIIYELMEESVLMPFINSVCAYQTYSAPWESRSSEELYLRGSLDERLLKRNRKGGSPPPHVEVMSSSYSPSSSGGRSRGGSPFSAANRGGWHRHSSHFPNSPERIATNGSGDSIVTDDSMADSPGDSSPMTPPSTPPNCESPVSAGAGSPKYGKAEKSWKKMTGKLTWKKSRGTGEDRSL